MGIGELLGGTASHLDGDRGQDSISPVWATDLVCFVPIFSFSY